MDEVLRTLDDATRDVTPRMLGAALTGVAFLLALLIGLATSAEWQTLLLWQRQAGRPWRTRCRRLTGPGATTAVGLVRRSGVRPAADVLPVRPAALPGRGGAHRQHPRLAHRAHGHRLPGARTTLDGAAQRPALGVAPGHPGRPPHRHRRRRLPARQVQPGVRPACLPVSRRAWMPPMPRCASRPRTS